jgi:hypothetical protein
MTYKEQKAKYAVRPSPAECVDLFVKAIEAYRQWDKVSPEPSLTDSKGNVHLLSVLCGYVWQNRDIMPEELIEVFARLDTSLYISSVARSYCQAARRLRQLIVEIVDGDIREDFGLKPSIPLTVGAWLH